MSARLRRAAVLSTTLVVVLGARSSGAQATDPTVTIDRTGTASGETMLVTGGGWPNGASLIVELCGHGGLRGTVDCDVSRQRTAGVGPSGTFSVELTSGVPPTPCPCVVKATDQTSQIAATAPIAVAGIPTVPITEVDQGPPRSIEISSIEITGGARWTELLGAGGRRVLEVSLVNTGAVAVDAPDLSIAWGSGSSPSGFVDPPKTERMEPGDTQTVTVSLDTPALAFGERTAVVEIQGLGEPVVARTSMTSYPWGLLVLGLVALQLLLLRLRNRLRRRVQRSAAHRARGGPAKPNAGEVLALPTAEPDEAAEPSEVEVIDLDAQQDDAPTPPVEASAIDVGVPSVADEPAEVSGHELLPAEPAESETESASVTLDLTELERSDGAAAASEPPRASVAANGSTAPVDAARRAAERAVRRAETEATEIVAAARDRLVHVEAEAPARIEEAEARCERDLELLDAVWRRAEALAKAAEAAVEAARQEIEADIERARQALADAGTEHASRVEDARRALARAEESVRTSSAEDEPRAGLSASPSPEPRVDELDKRLARAVERALASMGPRSAN